MASLLQAGSALSRFALALTFASVLALLLASHELQMSAVTALGATALLGLVERYLAFRLRFDEGLFDAMARGDIASLDDLDHALASLGVRPPPANPAFTRSLVDRVRGTRRLMRHHASIVVCQALFMLIAFALQEFL